MADEIQSFEVTIPAGVSPDNPTVFNLSMPPRYVDEVQVQVPPGPRGEVGFQIGAAGKQVYPSTPGQFVVTDNELVRWPIEHAISSGAWQLLAYNTGGLVHTLWVRFLVRVPGLSGPSGPQGGQLQPLLPTDLEPAQPVGGPGQLPDLDGLPLPPELTAPPLPPLPPLPDLGTLPGPPPLPGLAPPGAQALPGTTPPGSPPAIDWEAVEALGQAILEGSVNPPLDPWEQAELNGQGALEGLPALPPPPPAPRIYPLLLV